MVIGLFRVGGAQASLYVYVEVAAWVRAYVIAPATAIISTPATMASLEGVKVLASLVG
jgi:hypothetical protein